jgi:hypothetical protein
MRTTAWVPIALVLASASGCELLVHDREEAKASSGASTTASGGGGTTTTSAHGGSGGSGGTTTTSAHGGSGGATAHGGSGGTTAQGGSGGTTSATGGAGGGGGTTSAHGGAGGSGGTTSAAGGAGGASTTSDAGAGDAGDAGGGVTCGPALVRGQMAGNSCAINAKCELWCWGGDAYRQLGDMNNTPSASAVHVPWPTPVKSAAGGFDFVCAIGDDGAVRCIGRSDCAQTGHGKTNVPALSAGLVSLPTKAVAIDANAGEVCAALDDGSLWCWGGSDCVINGAQLAARSPTPMNAVAASGDKIVDVALGTGRVCATRASGKVTCAGSFDGLFGEDALAAGALEYVSGDYHQCQVRPGGAIRCRGGNGSGQVGNGTAQNPLEMGGRRARQRRRAHGRHARGRGLPRVVRHRRGRAELLGRPG